MTPPPYFPPPNVWGEDKLYRVEKVLEFKY